MNNVLLLEDHYDSIIYFENIILSVLPNAEILTASSVRKAKTIANETAIDLALLDINLPDGRGTDVIQNLLSKEPNCLVIMVTIYDQDETLFKALRQGARGYLLKQDTRENITNAMKGMLSGVPPLSASVTNKIIEYFHPSAQSHNLSPRETEVLSLLSKGFNRTEVAELIGITKNTASGYIKQIYLKLNVSSRAEAIVEAARMGLVDVLSK